MVSIGVLVARRNISLLENEIGLYMSRELTMNISHVHMLRNQTPFAICRLQNKLNLPTYNGPVIYKIKQAVVLGNLQLYS